jgi:hypothetical protein
MKERNITVFWDVTLCSLTLNCVSEEPAASVLGAEGSYSSTRVEAGSNNSTVTLRVVRGDEMGLKKKAAP